MAASAMELCGLIIAAVGSLLAAGAFFPRSYRDLKQAAGIGFNFDDRFEKTIKESPRYKEARYRAWVLFIGITGIAAGSLLQICAALQ